MTKLYSPKEALIEDGTVPVKPGKGRMSLAADARCRELAAQGWNIKGYVAAKASVSTTAAPVEVKKVAASNEKVIEQFTVLYDAKVYKAVGDGLTFNMATICYNDGVSLVQCTCGKPRVLGSDLKYHNVKIVSR